MVVLLGSPDFSIETSAHSPVAFAYSLSILYLVSSFISVLSDGLQASHLICRQCGHEVACIDDLVHIPSSLALRQRNDTIQSKDKTIVQLFQNPEGKYFEVITFSKAEVLKADKPHKEDTWFPGFSWSIVICPTCGVHMGWFFESFDSDYHTGEKKSFYGLILSHLVHQEYADSLIIAPKSYVS
ncbi:protein cereblon isoform X1 [Octopus bimaculoides]|uniref:CULT domain-containing protein n=1 Tax=Octopus bimaculoides TaxID=37653 RepID=A0A0L8FMN4_OCTBM|nr:protein cereblon isoform X1 [Octopus bimaculoides]|eukprot:XP_014788483.1 PREDICTED: protein cereblon-like [Octopus bimaculoides]